ncbi:unnamed protein product [Urochloa humidicola]
MIPRRPHQFLAAPPLHLLAAPPLLYSPSLLESGRRELRLLLFPAQGRSPSHGEWICRHLRVVSTGVPRLLAQVALSRTRAQGNW